MDDLYSYIIHLIIGLVIGISVIENVKSEIDELYIELRKIEKTLDEIKKSLWIEPDDTN